MIKGKRYLYLVILFNFLVSQRTRFLQLFILPFYLIIKLFWQIKYHLYSLQCLIRNIDVCIKQSHSCMRRKRIM